MFWIGFAIIPMTMLLLMLLMTGSGKLLNRLEKFFVSVKEIVCTIVFTFLTYVFTLLYSMVAVISGNMLINALLCAVFLVFSWCIVEKMYQKLSGEDGDTENEKTLSYKDKNVCQLWALIAVALSSMLLGIENSNKDYIILLSIAISIWIGAYVPVSEIYKGIRLKKIFMEIVSEFKNTKWKVTITAIISAAFMVFLISENELAQKINLVIDEMGKGIATSSIILILVLIVYELSKDKKSI